MTEKENRNDEMRSLKDAGCDDTFINKCCQCSREPDVLCMLQQQRDKLLEELHQVQRKLDCLDYTIYQLRNKKRDQ